MCFVGIEIYIQSSTVNVFVWNGLWYMVYIVKENYSLLDIYLPKEQPTQNVYMVRLQIDFVWHVHELVLYGLVLLWCVCVILECICVCIYIFCGIFHTISLHIDLQHIYLGMVKKYMDGILCRYKYTILYIYEYGEI